MSKMTDRQLNEERERIGNFLSLNPINFSSFARRVPVTRAHLYSTLFSKKYKLTEKTYNAIIDELRKLGYGRKNN